MVEVLLETLSESGPDIILPSPRYVIWPCASHVGFGVWRKHDDGSIETVGGVFNTQEDAVAWARHLRQAPVPPLAPMMELITK